MARARPPDLSATDWAVLGVVAEGTTHGFAVARQLAPDGELGRIWTVRRPLVYRSLATLERAGLVEEAGAAAGTAGPQRVLVRATARGRRQARRWLSEPVEHVRDIRSQLLLKLALLERSGADRAELVAHQRDIVGPMVEGLQARMDQATGFDAVVARWRLESAVAVDRFLAAL
ncbi:MAG TPA: PadR family transcriptional regulator [Acidimicrobiales bacterium]|nr:PadR family transcriptional regulator [Acidimicrobiales bacterium]